MLTRREITPGICYVNEKHGVAREVLRADHHTVRYTAYDLVSGKLRGPSHECSCDEFIRWADREATEDETFRMLYDELEALFRQNAHPAQKTMEGSMTIETATLMMRNNLINR